MLLGAGSASAHQVYPSSGGEPWTETLGAHSVSAVLMMATVALAGLLVAPIVVGPSPRPERLRRVKGRLAFFAAACDLVVLAMPGSVGSGVGRWPSWLVLVHLGLVLSVLIGAGEGRRASVPLAAALILAVAATGHASWLGGGPVVDAVVGIVHGAAAAVWLGGVLYLGLTWKRGAEGSAWLSAASRRFGPAAAIAAVTTVGSGVWNMVIHGAWSTSAVASAYGRVLFAKVILVGGVVLGLGVLVRRWAQPVRGRLASLGTLVTAEAVVVVVVVGLAAALVGVPSPAAGMNPGAALLRRVNLAGRWLTVSVTPQRVGDNAVEVLGDDSGAVSLVLGHADVRLSSPRDGRRTAIVRLAPGRSTLRVRAGDDSTGITLDTDRARRGAVDVADVVPLDGPDEMECASRHLGRLVALAEASAKGRRRYQMLTSVVQEPLASVQARFDGRDVSAYFEACAGATPRSPRVPAVEPSPAQAATSFVRFLANHGVTHVLVVHGGSSRGRELTERAAAVAGESGVAVEAADAPVDLALLPNRVDAIMVATGWGDAAATLATLVQSSVKPQRGIYLAPWLLTPELLTAGLNPEGIQVSVAATQSPNSPPAFAYLSALRRFAPGAAPTASGMVGYLEAISATAKADQPAAARRSAELPPSRMEFFTPVRLRFLPPPLGHDHTDDGGVAGWLPGATLASIGNVPLS